MTKINQRSFPRASFSRDQRPRNLLSFPSASRCNLDGVRRGRRVHARRLFSRRERRKINDPVARVRGRGRARSERLELQFRSRGGIACVDAVTGDSRQCPLRGRRGLVIYSWKGGIANCARRRHTRQIRRRLQAISVCNLRTPLRAPFSRAYRRSPFLSLSFHGNFTPYNFALSFISESLSYDS